MKTIQDIRNIIQQTPPDHPGYYKPTDNDYEDKDEVAKYDKLHEKYTKDLNKFLCELLWDINRFLFDNDLIPPEVTMEDAAFLSKKMYGDHGNIIIPFWLLLKERRASITNFYNKFIIGPNEWIPQWVVHLKLEPYSYESPKIRKEMNDRIIEERVKWCKQNTKNFEYNTTIIWLFESKDDAIKFFLTFSK